MAKYKLPVIANSFIEVEADNLEKAINKAYKEKIHAPGIDYSSIDNWEIDQWKSFEKDGKTVEDEESELYISDIMNQSEY